MTKIAVIGAGLAGLTAAYRMEKSGLNVDVFEARNRVGGRVFTVHMRNYLGSETALEMGGQNIMDGGDAENTLNLIKELDLKVKQKFINLEHFVKNNGKYIKLSELIKKHHKSVVDLKDLSHKAHNIGHLIEMFCEKNVQLMKALLNLMSDHEGIDVYKQSIYYNLDDLEHLIAGSSPKCYQETDHPEGEVLTTVVDGGNARLPIKLVQELRGGVIRYNKTLRKIIMKHSSVVIIFADESQYEYDKIILANPASTFKDMDFTESGLSNKIIEKIHSIEYGQNYKIAFPITKPHTPKTNYAIDNDSSEWYTYDDMIKIVYACDSVIDAYNSGEIKTHPIRVFDENYYTYDKPIMHNWNHDPYAYGSYAGYSVHISKELDETEAVDGIVYKQLFKPVNNRLFFTGEHTTLSKYIGTMEAAVESGERIANAIIKSVRES